MTESVWLWSKTAASNASSDGAIGWAEGQAPSSVNNSARSMMAAIAKMRDDIGGALVSTGSSNEYTITTNQSLAAHANGVFVTFRADKTSTGAATTTIDGLAQKNILRADATATTSGDIVSGGIYTLRYSSAAGHYLATNLQAPLTATLSAIGALTATDSNIIVGNGSTWVAESGATARTSLGVGTGDSPQFTGVELGHATDTTIARVAAGRVAVEGLGLVRGPTTPTDSHVALYDSTTGDLIKSAGRVLTPTTTRGDIIYRGASADLRLAAGTEGQILTMGASDPEWAAAAGLAAATQAEMETATSVAVASTPGRQQFHPGHPKCWALVTVSAGTPTLQTSYNITSITDTAMGQLTVTIATDFSAATWACLMALEGVSAIIPIIDSGSRAAGSIILESYNTSASLADPTAYHMAGFGDQA